jgi:excisionase family DNA binding protein
MEIRKVLYSRREAAATLSLGVRTLDELILLGAIPAVRIGRRVLIAREALLRFVDQKQTRGGDHEAH